MAAAERISSNACFGGRQSVWRHASTTLGVDMSFGVYEPPQAADRPCPVLWFLSGLTCTAQNVITKGGFQQHCARHGIILVAPDTSPRGPDLPDDPAYDLGQGAGFYLNATQAPWSKSFQMYDYVVDELPEVVGRLCRTNGRHAVTGHSMGGLGALVVGLRNPDVYESVSAFAPIVSPSSVPWGEKAFRAYLGPDETRWRPYDPTHLVERHASSKRTLLIDQGTDDEFLGSQLDPEGFAARCAAVGQPVDLRMQPGYDHSYYFIATFAGDHVQHHAEALGCLA